MAPTPHFDAGARAARTGSRPPAPPEPTLQGTAFPIAAALAGIAFAFGQLAFAFGANIHVDGNSSAGLGEVLAENMAPLAPFLSPGLVVVVAARVQRRRDAQMAFSIGMLACPWMLFNPYVIALAALAVAVNGAYRRHLRQVPWDLVALTAGAGFMVMVLWAELTR